MAAEDNCSLTWSQSVDVSGCSCQGRMCSKLRRWRQEVCPQSMAAHNKVGQQYLAPVAEGLQRCVNYHCCHTLGNPFELLAENEGTPDYQLHLTASTKWKTGFSSSLYFRKFFSASPRQISFNYSLAFYSSKMN